MKQQILVDMDGVLADIYTQFITLEYKRSGKKLRLEEMYGKAEDLVFPSFKEDVNSVGFFRTAPLISDSVEGIKYLNDKYNVLTVSSATEFPNSLNEKRAWLAEFYPFISWRQMIFCGNKEHIKGDIMIDDHPKNLHHFSGRKILFTQPHNADMNVAEFERVSSWKEIMKLL